MHRFVVGLGLVACAGACDGGPEGTPVTLTFAGKVGAEDFRCGGTYPGIGATSSELTVADLRFYVHAVRLVTEDGAEAAVTLDADGMWQTAEVALLDFEDGTAACEGGNRQLNGTVRGHASLPGPYAGVRFVLGVPFAQNHADASIAPSPLNLTAMFWGWQGGYKFLRFEGRSTGQPAGFLQHIGSTGCNGDAGGNVTMCAEPNRAEIRLDGVDPEATTIVADLAELLAGVDIDANAPGTPAGCMSASTDPDCAGVFANLGLPFGGGPPGTQRFFRTE